MEQDTLEAISITALVISVIVLVVLVFMLIRGHLSARGEIVKMNGGNDVSEQLNTIKDDIQSIAYMDPASNEYANAINIFPDIHDMVLTLYAIFSFKLIEHPESEVREAADRLFDVCKNNLMTDNNPLILKTITMIEDQARRPIPVREAYDLDDEWFHYLRLPRDACARPIRLR